MHSRIVEISYSIKLTETQSDILGEKNAADFITYMENQTPADKIGWVSSKFQEFYIFFVTLPYKDSIEKVIEFLEESLGTE